MGLRRRKIDGPREAVRWIGDAFIVDGSLARTARAVWRGGKTAQLAKARVVEMIVDYEFLDETPQHLAASVARGEGIVPRFVTYRSEDSLVVVEHDLADLSLRELIDALRGGDVPPGLAVYVARSITRACRAASMQESVRLAMIPRDIDVAWDGAVYLRPAPPEIEDDIDWDDDVVERVSYRAGVMRTVGILMFELLTGRHPFVDEGADADDDDVVEGILARIDANEAAPLPLGVPDEIHDVIETLLESESAFSTWDGLDKQLQEIAPVDPFEKRDLEGMLRGLFEEKKRACDLEREDRLHVMPGPRVEPEEWRVFDADDPEEGDPYTADLDDVRHGRGEEERYEPSVDPIDPFDDE